MKQQYLVIPVNDEADIKKIHSVLLEIGFTKAFVLNNIPENLIHWLYMLEEPGSDYKRIESSDLLLNDPDFWNEIPEQAKIKLIQFLTDLWTKYQVPFEGYMLPRHLPRQSPPPAAGFMKGIISITDDFDAPLEDFKEYEQ